MVKLKLLLFPILFAFILFPFSFAFAQEDYTVDDDVVLYDTTAEDPEMDLQEYESDIWDTENAISDETEQSTSVAGLAMGYFITFLICLPIYIFTSLALAKIGKELGYKNSWFAWIPLLNLIMLMQLGEKSVWWILVPFVGGIMMIIAIMRITEKRGYDKLLGLIVLTGIGSYVLLYLLAWSPKTVATTPTTPVVSASSIAQPPLEEQIQQEAKTHPQQTTETPPTQSTK